MTKKQQTEAEREEARDASETNEYRIMKERQQREYNEFSANNTFFAFSNEQFDAGMKKLGLTPDDTKKICSIGAGGYMLKTASDALEELFTRFESELREAIDADKDGTGFTYEMFYYELSNHEYCYSHDTTSAIHAAGLTVEEVKTSEKLLKSLANAKRDYMERAEKYA